MVYKTSRRKYFFKNGSSHNKKVDSWDASTIESTAFSMTVPSRTTCTTMTTLSNIRPIHAEQLDLHDYQIQPYEFNELRFPAPMSFTVPTGRATMMISDPTTTTTSDASGRPGDEDNAEMPTGVMVEDLASPLDFLKTIRYEEVLNDFLGMEPLNCAHNTIDSSMSGEFLAAHQHHRLQGDAELQDQHEGHSDDNCKKAVVKSQECGVPTIHDVVNELTTGRMLLDGPSSPFAFMINVLQNGDLWPHVHIKEDAVEHESDDADWENQENYCEPVHDPTSMPENHHHVHEGFAMAGTSGGLPPRCPPRHTTVVKEFGVRRGRRLGPRRWVAHEIPQNKPTPGMVVVSSSPRNSEPKLKSAHQPNPPTSHRKKKDEKNATHQGQRMSSLSRLSHKVTSLRQNRAYV